MKGADESNDRELFTLIAAGDEDALAELYRRYRIQIFRFLLYQLQDEQAAEEILQDVFLAAWQRAGSFRGHASVKTWLLRVAYYRSATWLSDQKPSITLENIEELPADTPGPDDRVDALWLSDQIQQAFTQLTPKHRTAIELIFYHELSYKEAAKVLGCPVGTMKSRVNHALRQTGRLLQKTGLNER